ncbi:poly(glycerol-phosphate) alpha-glucosyltransferase [Brevibacterium jeotgali]|uniref:Poly(Glycerol-phosphate) alpha-glucosyltransferase n=1 Tax=Brevibacterium jeotgali TaxID=1262550 RepID=A0A2H1L8U0_9MICO|nr:glycosyltransferase [Brevibacterium jeotgali]TWB98813.1 poly(glycerol-phosphate) alpha-glucosyltransferase [Brevibacterium jeotgali]SMY13170.1 poly(glycerol-phosphate) alpha-glucosyltransferase [Brevibacterium jeotgali]
MRRRQRILPDVPIFHLLWEIPESFGGMTTVALRRASLLADADKRRLDVLTLSPDLSPRRRQRELSRDGLISRRVRIRNLWEELRRSSDSALARMSEGSPASSHSDHERTPTTGRTDYVLTGDDERAIQVARFRSDGTLLLTDRHDVTRPGQRGGRRLTLYASGGEAIGQWSSATSFYHAWLRCVIGTEQSVIICDSAFVGGLMHAFRSPHGSLIQVIHSHHHAPESSDTESSALGPPTPGNLAPGKLPILTNADRYDLVAVLTERQKQHLLDEDIGSDNLVAIPNPFHGRASTAARTRPRGRGIVASRLSGIKRLDHAIRALASSTSTTSTLDIYGDGEERDSLADCITDLDLDGRVRLHGHDPHARRHFARSSFSLLTSRAEGQSLTIVESMASGCIPLAYDIDYGPSDIITDGVDGFLVPAGRPDALARAIDTFLALDEQQVAQMRKAALETSQRFLADTIAAKWADALHRVVSASPVEDPAGNARISAHLVDVSPVDERVIFTVRVDDLSPGAMAWAKLALVERHGSGYLRLPMQVSSQEHTVLLHGELAIDRLVAGSFGVLDVFLDLRVDDARTRTRLEAGDRPEPAPIGDLEVYATKHGNASIRRAG